MPPHQAVQPLPGLWSHKDFTQLSLIGSGLFLLMCVDRQLVQPLVEVHESQPLHGIGATVQQVSVGQGLAGLGWALAWRWLGVDSTNTLFGIVYMQKLRLLLVYALGCLGSNQQAYVDRPQWRAIAHMSLYMLKAENWANAAASVCFTHTQRLSWRNGGTLTNPHAACSPSTQAVAEAVQSGNRMLQAGGGPAAADIGQLAVGGGGGGIMAMAWTGLAELIAAASVGSVPPAARAAGFAAGHQAAIFLKQEGGSAAAAVTDEGLLGLGQHNSALLHTLHLDGVPPLDFYRRRVGAPAASKWLASRRAAVAEVSSFTGRVQAGLPSSVIQEWAAALSGTKDAVISNCGLPCTSSTGDYTVHQCLSKSRLSV